MLSPLMVIQYPLIAVYPAAIYSATSPDGGEITRQRLSGPLHRNRTAPPSLWPGFEFTEVSLALYAVIARTGATRPLQKVLSLAQRVSLRGHGAPTCAASAFSRHTGMYLMNVYLVFKLLFPGWAGGKGNFIPSLDNGHFFRNL